MQPLLRAWPLIRLLRGRCVEPTDRITAGLSSSVLILPELIRQLNACQFDIGRSEGLRSDRRLAHTLLVDIVALPRQLDFGRSWLLTSLNCFERPRLLHEAADIDLGTLLNHARQEFTAPLTSLPTSQSTGRIV